MISSDVLVNLRKWLAERGPQGVADWFAEGGLRLDEFTALLGVVGDGTGLKQDLSALDAVGSAYASVRSLHNLRWILLSPGAKNATTNALLGEAAEKALVLSFVFEGDADDALGELLEQVPVEPILRHCSGFRAGDDAAAYLAKHRVRSGYMFRDLGPVTSDSYTPDATRAEIEDARALELRFEAFYAKYSNASPGILHSEFLKTFGDDGFAFALTAFERPLPNEARWVRRVSELIRRLQTQAARQDPRRVKRRGAHAKAHGLIKASFEILGPTEIPARFRVGLFAKPGARFDAHIRPSNGAHTIASDRAPDARGLAISVDIPLGSQPGEYSAADFLQRPAEALIGRQDFVLMSHPRFFASDIRRLAVLMSILTTKPLATKLGRAFAFACGSGGLTELGIALRTFMGRVAHPFAADYHSVTPYLFGEDHVVKYSVESDDRRRFEQLKREQGQNFLSAALRESLKTRPIELGFYLHVLSASVVPDNARSIRDVVEDATLDWRVLGAEKVRVATIRIGPQDPTTPSHLLLAEEWDFNPWYALKLHRPLGSLNRARLSIYPASHAFRRKPVSGATEAGARSTPPRGLSEAAE